MPGSSVISSILDETLRSSPLTSWDDIDSATVRLKSLRFERLDNDAVSFKFSFTMPAGNSETVVFDYYFRWVVFLLLCVSGTVLLYRSVLGLWWFGMGA